MGCTERMKFLPRVIEAASRDNHRKKRNPMSDLLNSVCHFVLPVFPDVSASVHHRMLMVTGLFQGIVDLEPHRTGRVPKNVLWMPGRHLLVAGTRCPRPALLNEAADAAANVGLDMLIVRDEIDNSFELRTSFDIRLDDEKRWRCGYYLWQSAEGRLYLLPDEDRPAGLRVAPLGFVVIDKSPYADRTDWDAGLMRANGQLNRAAWRR